jgi:dGTPase
MPTSRSATRSTATQNPITPSFIPRKAPRKAKATIIISPPLIGFSPAVAAEQMELKQFLRHALYRHYRVVRMSGKSQRILSELFSAFLGDHRLLPPQDQARAGVDAPRAIADYIAGMTDRYAIREHRRLFSVDEH